MLEIMREYFLKFTGVHIYKLIGWNFINKKKAEI